MFGKENDKELELYQRKSAEREKELETFLNNNATQNVISGSEKFVEDVEENKEIRSLKGRIRIYKALKTLNTFTLTYAGVVGIGANLVLQSMNPEVLVETIIVGATSTYAIGKLNHEIKSVNHEIRYLEDENEGVKYR